MNVGMNVGMWVWPQVSLAPGADVTFDHWVVDGNGFSLIDPDHWYAMSAVPDYTPDQRPDRPASAAGVTIAEQGAFRPRESEADPNHAVWRVRWRVPAEAGFTWFRPRMLVAPA